MKSDQDQLFAKQFGEFIRNAREKRGMYQEDVAQQIGISRAYLSTLELGKRNVDFGMALKICDVLRVDLNEFIQSCRQ